MTNQSRQPKLMASKFAGHCDNCGRHIETGEMILWLSRGVIECDDCMTSNEVYDTLLDNVPETPSDRQTGDKWAKALSWDANQTPKTPEPTTAARACHNNVVIGGESIKPELIATSRVECTNEITKPKTDEPLPSLDPQAQTVCDLLVTLVNAIDRMSTDQCATVKQHAQDFWLNSASASRRELWGRVADNLF